MTGMQRFEFVIYHDSSQGSHVELLPRSPEALQKGDLNNLVCKTQSEAETNDFQ